MKLDSCDHLLCTDCVRRRACAKGSQGDGLVVCCCGEDYLDAKRGAETAKERQLD